MMINFDSYLVSETKTAKTLPLSCPAPYSNKGLGQFIKLRKKGFTLAETLITLTIIGVIAALTVPTLISNYQKHTYVTRLKKAHSELQNAMKMIPISEGCPAGDYECAGLFKSDGSPFIIDAGVTETKKLAKQFKTVKEILEYNNNDAGCKKLANGFDNYNGTGMPCFYTADGMTITSTTGYTLIDVNGPKGPNMWGRDKFTFKIAPRTWNNVPVGTVMPDGSKLYSTYKNDSSLYWKNNNKCTSAYSTFGVSSGCTGRVLEEDAMNY